MELLRVRPVLKNCFGNCCGSSLVCTDDDCVCLFLAEKVDVGEIAEEKSLLQDQKTTSQCLGINYCNYFIVCLTDHFFKVTA